MDVEAGSLANGAKAILWPCTGNNNQLWKVEKTDVGYRLTAQHSGKVLEVVGGSTASGAGIDQWGWSNISNQKWNIRSTSTGLEIASVKSSKCLDVTGGSAADGTKFQQWDCNASGAQRFRLVAPGADYSGTYSLVHLWSNKCLDIANASTTDGANVQLYTCNGTAAQTWKVERADIGYRLTAQHSGKVLDVTGSATANGTQVIQWSWGNTSNQKWNIRSSATGLELLAIHSDKCLDINGNATADGTKVQEWDCNASAAQQFKLVSPGAPSSKSTQGEWGPLIAFPLIPVAAANLPDGRILMWSAYDGYAFSGGNNGYTRTAVYNPTTGQTTESTISNTQHDMFCPGTALLGDGRVLVTGGSGAEVTSIYNPALGAWSRDANLNVGRGYNTAVTLFDGRVLTLGGTWSGGGGDKYGEIWTDGLGWKAFAGASALPLENGFSDGRGNQHAWLIPTPDGRVLSAGPSPQMQWYSFSGNGSYTSAGSRANDLASQNAVKVIYSTGKTLKAGGAGAYDPGTNTNKLSYVIDTNNGLSVRQVASMQYARDFANGVVLPNGEVLVVGGNTSGKTFSDEGSVLTPEIWNPNSEQWRPMSNHLLGRNYHSVAILMTDGRVLSAGGGLCGSGCAANHPDGQIFSPPYLFNTDGSVAVRPQIVSSPASLSYNQSFTLTTNTPVARFSLIRMSSVTHSVNTDQRFINVVFSGSGTNYTLTAPSNAAAVPGNYMLFALNSQGVPSVAKIIRIGN